MLYYLPLEPYVERYTALMSCKDGWAENHFKKFNIPFKRIDGETCGDGRITSGVVLDACGRSYYAMSQIMQLVKLIHQGDVKDNDVIYVEDFWHPGIESLFYIRHLTGIKYKIGTFIHAQSVDDTDFAYAMRDWMRPIEQGFGKQYDFIFTCSDILRKLCIDAGIANESNIFTVGLPYNSKKLLGQLKDMGVKTEQRKEDFVLFASRFDAEKDPNFFLDLVEACPDIDFVLVNPRKNRPISNDPEVVERLKTNKPANLRIVETFEKSIYYDLLAKAKVVFNCAHQDWVSWTLLEATTFKCHPLYPIWKDFPVELHNDSKYLYKKQDLNEAKEKLHKLIKEDFDTKLNYVVEKHDNSWPTYLKIMGLI